MKFDIPPPPEPPPMIYRYEFGGVANPPPPEDDNGIGLRGLPDFGVTVLFLFFLAGTLLSLGIAFWYTFIR